MTTPKTKPINTGAELKAARVALDLDRVEFGEALGLGGARRSIQIKVAQYENETRGAPPRHIRLLAECFLQGARPHTWPASEN